MSAQSNLLSIGALSRATGVPADTLRTWERRYGFPSAERTDSGHRRYSMLTLERLRLATRALEQGHRPATALTASLEQLESLLRLEPSPASSASSSQALDSTATRATVESSDAKALLEALALWIGHVERYEGRSLDRELRTAYAELGGQAFLEERVGPFIVAIGERWARGELSVGHEHFVSERLRELLTGLWRPLSDSATGPAFICAAPPDELHVLGLHMAALTIALSNGRVIFLGANTPVAEIAAAVQANAAAAVILSASASCERRALAHHVAELRAALPSEVPLLGGGAGLADEPAGILVLRRFGGLRSWLKQARV